MAFAFRLARRLLKDLTLKLLVTLTILGGFNWTAQQVSGRISINGGRDFDGSIGAKKVWMEVGQAKRERPTP